MYAVFRVLCNYMRIFLKHQLIKKKIGELILTKSPIIQQSEGCYIQGAATTNISSVNPSFTGPDKTIVEEISKRKNSSEYLEVDKLPG